jgi:hypothetical protein
LSRDSSWRQQSLKPAGCTSQTSGATLADGRTVDLIADEGTGHLKLIWFDGTHYRVADRIDIGHGAIVPLALDPAIQAAMALPTEPSDYGNTERLFTESRDVLTAHGMSQQVAAVAIHYAFATWFPEAGAPCMTISGPGAEVTLLLQLMSCLVRRGLLMVEFDSHGFRGLMDSLRPTLLIDARSLSVRSLRKLSAACGSGAYVPWKGSVANFSFARAIYLGVTPINGFSPDFSLRIHLWPSGRALSLLAEKERAEIIKAFQPRFLDYRLRNLDRVRASDFELPEMDSESGIIGRILGGCIVDAPEIQAGIRPLLEGREAWLRAARWTDSTCVIIEALLDKCHSRVSGRIRVGEIAQEAEVILRARGSLAKLEPRAVGEVLRRLGFVSKRRAPGYGIPLTNDMVVHIHRLAHDHRVAAVADGIACCPTCIEMFKASRKTDAPT